MFRRRTTEVDAFQWTGGPDQKEDPAWFQEALSEGLLEIVNPGTPDVLLENNYSFIEPGGWVVKRKEEIILYSEKDFHSRYEEVK